MRVEYIQCDTCEKKHDAQYALPPDWIRTIQRTDYDLEEEHHFCSKACLIAWASKGKPTGVIITDRLLSEADIAVLRKAVREYDGSMPLAEYLEKRLSIGIEYITLRTNDE